jgi:hypothetical protein
MLFARLGDSSVDAWQAYYLVMLHYLSWVSVKLQGLAQYGAVSSCSPLRSHWMIDYVWWLVLQGLCMHYACYTDAMCYIDACVGCWMAGDDYFVCIGYVSRLWWCMYVPSVTILFGIGEIAMLSLVYR